jgi:hypothetical protein
MSVLPRRSPRKLLLLLLIPAGLLGAFAWRITDIPPDPVHRGQRLSWWLKNSKPAGATKLSARDLRAIGPSGVRWLAYAAEHGHRPNLRRPPRGKLESHVRKLREWSDRLFHVQRDDYDERREALYGLNQLGSDAAPAIPALVRILQNSTKDYGSAAADALIHSGPAARDDVLRLFAEGPRIIRVCLIMNLPHYGAAPAENLEYLMAGSRDPDPELRLTAFYSLKNFCIRNRFSSDTDRVAPFAIEFLSTSQVPAYERIEFLAGFGERAAPAIPQLINLLDDPEPTTRSAASFALMMADPKGLTIAPRMHEFLLSSNPVRQQAARRILRNLGELPPN